MIRGKRKLTYLDAFVGAFVLAFAGYVIYRITVGLEYKWNWGAIPQYILRYDEESRRLVPNLLLQGLFTTIRLSLWGTLIATAFGTIMGLCRVSHGLFNRLIGRTYVELMRNLPPLVIIFIFYYFMSGQIMEVLGVDDFVLNLPEWAQALVSLLFAPPSLVTPFLSSLVALAIFEGAYITEIIRSGIQSIERGIWEAGYALGLTRWQQMRHVILPLTVQRVLPPLGSQFISTIKDSAIVSVISIQELTFQGMELMAATYLTFEVWITITVLYLILTLSLSFGVDRLEIYLRRSEA
ncbi:MAG: amino acid ABC transporter permease [Deltaproteobacteria bacterium]|nr:amino acid ABC transporter permease [Deltaproteobacteria bacterium]